MKKATFTEVARALRAIKWGAISHGVYFKGNKKRGDYMKIVPEFGAMNEEQMKRAMLDKFGARVEFISVNGAYAPEIKRVAIVIKSQATLKQETMDVTV
jgi:hypothetical protein